MKKYILLISIVFAVSDTKAQNKDLDAQYLYAQAENAYAKNEFEQCVNYCEKAALTLGDTNPKILLLQFNAYEGIIQKCPYNSILGDNREKIDSLINFFFSHIDLQTYPKEKYFEAKKFKEDRENMTAILQTYKAAKINPYTLTDLGGLVTKERYSGTKQYIKVVSGPLKEQLSIDGFWVEPIGDDRSKGSGLASLLETIRNHQELAMYRCQESFTVEIWACYPNVNDFSAPHIKLDLKTQLIK